ncbi:hypothetical protein AVEN_128973-1 [Araneus ventricosus]|uniref:Uncharacterized protein n=1 Tax=Araneus ventricosus TaxID=182803 RepID=A0A4Y2QAM2_ARAVE|nr:hypothetical protein AVEN_128973-1 [Araneus ventricosus]
MLPTTILALEFALAQEWPRKPQELIDSLIQSMPYGCRSVFAHQNTLKRQKKNWYRRAYANNGDMQPIIVTRCGRQRLYKTTDVCQMHRIGSCCCNGVFSRFK